MSRLRGRGRGRSDFKPFRFRFSGETRQGWVKGFEGRGDLKEDSSKKPRSHLDYGSRVSEREMESNFLRSIHYIDCLPEVLRGRGDKLLG